jgi:hypothetical protein
MYFKPVPHVASKNRGKRQVSVDSTSGSGTLQEAEWRYALLMEEAHDLVAQGRPQEAQRRLEEAEKWRIRVQSYNAREESTGLGQRIKRRWVRLLSCRVRR